MVFCCTRKHSVPLLLETIEAASCVTHLPLPLLRRFNPPPLASPYDPPCEQVTAKLDAWPPVDSARNGASTSMSE